MSETVDTAVGPRPATDGAATTTRTVRGRATGAVVRLGRLDPLTCDTAVSMVFFLDRAVDDEVLAGGLARTLDHLPICAGRLQDRGEGLEIVCDGAGVPYVSTAADLTTAEAIEAITRSDAELADHVDTRATGLGDGPLMRVRATRLRDGGMALGVSYNHLLGDARTLMSVMQVWSALVDGREPPPVTVIADRDAFLDDVLPAEDTGRSGYRLMDPPEAAEVWAELADAARDISIVQICFTRAETDRMRKRFALDAGRALTDNDVLCAHLLDTLSRLGDDTETRHLGFPVDIRPYLKLPPTTVGNLISIVDVARAPGTRPEALAGAVRDTATGFLGSHLNLRADLAFVESCDPARLGECVARAIDPRRRVLVVSNVGDFTRRHLTFGGCQPVYFCPVPSRTVFQLPWMGVLYRGFKDQGYFCTLSLPAPVAEALRQPPGAALLHRFRAPDDPRPVTAIPLPALI